MSICKIELRCLAEIKDASGTEFVCIVYRDRETLYIWVITPGRYQNLLYIDKAVLEIQVPRAHAPETHMVQADRLPLTI